MSDTAYAERDVFINGESSSKLTDDHQSGNWPTSWGKIMLTFKALQVQWTQIICVILFHCSSILYLNLCLVEHSWCWLIQKHTFNIAVEWMYIHYLHHFVNISDMFSCTITPPFNAFSSLVWFFFFFSSSSHCHCCCTGLGHPDLAGCSWLLFPEGEEAAAIKAPAHFC